jgi:hypothetical protein
MPIDVTVTDENVNVSVSGGVGPAGSSAWADITGKPSEFVPTRHADDHAEGGADALTLTDVQIETTIDSGIFSAGDNLQTSLTNLETAIDGKAAAVHAHEQTDVASQFGNSSLAEDIQAIDAGKSAYVQAATYAAMISAGTPAVLTVFKVTADENKGATNTVYQVWPDGRRLWIAALPEA